MAFRSVHVPYVGSPTLRNNCSSSDPTSVCYHGPSLDSRQLDYFACIVGIDNAVGRMRAAVRQYRDDWQNTIVVFTSDNGPESIQNEGAGSAGGLRGTKGSLFEGGIRLPCLLEWPVKIHTNLVSNALTAIHDLPATLESVITNNAPKAFRDGISLLQVIDAPQTFQRPFPLVICSHGSPEAVNLGVICPDVVVIDPTGTWKLIISRSKVNSANVGKLIVSGLYSIPQSSFR